LLLTLCFIFVTSEFFTLFLAAELSSPADPFESLAGPEAEKENAITKMAEAIMDKVVSQLLNEAAEAVLKEE
jgi:hypothetical protein